MELSTPGIKFGDAAHKKRERVIMVDDLLLRIWRETAGRSHHVVQGAGPPQGGGSQLGKIFVIVFTRGAGRR